MASSVTISGSSGAQASSGICICCARSCDNCPDHPTPRRWMLTFFGVGTAVMFCNGECINNVKGSGESLETYPLDQSPDNPCVWQYNGPGPTVNIGGDAPDCGANGTNYDSMQITLIKQVTGYQLSVIFTGPFGVSAPFWFADDGTSTSNNCRDAQTFTNFFTVAGGYSCVNFGIGGTAVATPL